MTFPTNPNDRPDPLENMPAVRARVPDHVASGEISTGVIVVTGGTEYVLDFVRNLPRPNCVVSRVVLPHLVMPQFIDALTTNIELFRQRYGDLPGTPSISPISSPSSSGTPASEGGNANNPVVGNFGGTIDTNNLGASSGNLGSSSGPVHPNDSQNAFGANANSNSGERQGADDHSSPADQHAGSSAGQGIGGMPPSHQPRRQNPQEVYDDLKIRDEILSGAYANAVMIGHGPYEFSFDFITQFYPQPAVSARVFMASGHVGRLLDSLKTSWEQIRGRYGYPPKQ